MASNPIKPLPRLAVLYLSSNLIRLFITGDKTAISLSCRVYHIQTDMATSYLSSIDLYRRGALILLNENHF
jgi:hypothetical protein